MKLLRNRVLAAVWLAFALSSVTQAEPVYLQPLIVTSVASDAGVRLELDPRQPRQPLPASDAGDYLLTIPGFSAVRGGGTNNDPVFRGMFGSRLNMLADGMPILGACPSRMDSPSSYIFPQSYDQLSVIKGPQSVLWGAGSAATVLFTRDPLRTAESFSQVQGTTLVGSAGRQEHSLSAALVEQIGYLRAQGSRSRGDDYRDGDGNEIHSQWNKWGSDLILGLTPSEDHLLELSLSKSDGQAAYAGRGMDGAQFLRESAVLRFELEQLSPHLHKLEARLYYNYADHVMDNFSLRRPSGSGMMAVPMATAVDRRSQGARVATHWQFAEHEWVIGLDAQRNEHRKRSSSYQVMTQTLRDADQFAWAKDASFSQVGAFTELALSQSERAKWVSGLRLDHWRANDFRAANVQRRDDTLPSMFVRYERDVARHELNWYAGIGHTQRFPDYWELFSPNAGVRAGVSAFEQVKPEKTSQLDLGLNYQLGAWQGWLSSYLGQVDDYIMFTYTPGMMGRMNAQASNIQARIAGAEVGGRYPLSSALQAEFALAYAWGENRTEAAPLAQMPPLEARVDLRYSKEDWHLGALWRVVGAQHRVAIGQGNVVGRDFGPSTGFAVFSLNAGYRFDERASLSAGIDNLFNRAYSEHLNQAGNASFGYAADTRLNEQGRTLWVRLDLSL